MKGALSLLAAVAAAQAAWALTPLPEALAKLPVVKGTERIVRELKPGVAYHQVHFANFTGDGPLAAHFLVIDWNRVGKDFTLAVADGRQSRSTGLSYGETRKLLEAWGCDRMTNLDGGGSSVMALADDVGVKPTMVNGRFKVMNVPSDGLPILSVERRVAESLMLVDR